MNNIITVLLLYIQIQAKIIIYLMCALFSKGSVRKYYDEPVRKPYRKLVVDTMPIIETLEKLDYKQLISNHLKETGKLITPITRRKASTVPDTMACPRCGAPHEYLYDNTGGKGQYLCKVCKCTFNKKNRYLKNLIFLCPHCGRTLELKKERKDFNVHKCTNSKCPYYLDRLNSMSEEDKQRYKSSPHDFKLHYIYREFDIDFEPLVRKPSQPPSVDISRLYVSPHVLGLILTYHVNFGLSTRMTAALMREVHGVSVSHQSVSNYADAVATNIKPFIDNYKYDLSDSICGDETYIKVLGKWHYVFFIFDAVKKIILSYPVSANRDVKAAIYALDEALSKFDKLPEDLTLIFDGNPIYMLAQHYFAQYGIHFDIKQVIGLTNDDPISEEYRPLKQIIERLNRTFKGNYRPTNGFNNYAGSVSFLTLFVAYFNFLRPHSSLEGRVPVVLEELKDRPNMPARWVTLIKMSQEYIKAQQSA
ncbi:transposase [Clostridium thermosuccinogenes]|uniref:Transposase n=2 Tax=Clostridium thermosuccinogenes TaxID=84032 RepID=A0A2K2EZ61_9CLOT|nr:DDE-type integrase/transposase/recombinase [Pseudoclostridium thermosuccinogenes]AUS95021.1 transposase [Pseudoclostridium thermosuccinogenes]AUS95347.1 transposase [Pseudoclostridium thermosuccinogenes]AUS95878.1 transposase [Pseudoclostridium thermosuccinogenes]AUS96203.1 transposase [Pseudoclostridium thermosuccinogenes]AUS96288.1 transposase [Pseudoclostridium thermosuccinogenes]